MSQFIPNEELMDAPFDDGTPLTSLETSADESMLETSDILDTMQMIESALQSVGKKKYDSAELPTYYDDLLMQLIDAIPLE